MSFTRTNSGISNLRLFYGVDLVMFTEGGKNSFSMDEVENGQYNSNSVDIKFWQNVLSANGFRQTVKFKAIGSKTASRSICERIISGEINNVAVAKDRDLNHYTDEIIDSPRILYTKGYSWENDVFTKAITLLQIESMIFEAEVSEEIISIVELAYKDFQSYGKHLIKLELIFRKNGIKFITGLNGERFIKLGEYPSIDRGEVSVLLESKKKDLRRPVFSGGHIYGICPLMNNYGKLIASLSVSIIACVCKKYSDYKAISKKMLEAAMIERFATKMTNENDVYYSNIVEKLAVA
jgi:hypothetical protein